MFGRVVRLVVVPIALLSLSSLAHAQMSGAAADGEDLISIGGFVMHDGTARHEYRVFPAGQ